MVLVGPCAEATPRKAPPWTPALRDGAERPPPPSGEESPFSAPYGPSSRWHMCSWQGLIAVLRRPVADSANPLLGEYLKGPQHPDSERWVRPCVHGGRPEVSGRSRHGAGARGGSSPRPLDAPAEAPAPERAGRATRSLLAELCLCSGVLTGTRPRKRSREGHGARRSRSLSLSHATGIGRRRRN